MEINSAGDVLEVLGSQAKNLLSFKAMGRILFMHKAGKIPPNSIDISKKQDLKFERVTKDGRDVFKVTYPDGKTEMANSMAEVIALSNQDIENVTLFNPLEKLLQPVCRVPALKGWKK